jgi:hypothetical protein
MGGLLTLGSFVKTFPEIDKFGAAPEDRSHVSTIQGIAVASYNVGKLETTIFQNHDIQKKPTQA